MVGYSRFELLTSSMSRRITNLKYISNSTCFAILTPLCAPLCAPFWVEKIRRIVLYCCTTIVSKRALTKRTRTTRGVGKFAASVYGWHSLRTSFVTLALQYGVPIEDVRKIVGHQSVRTTEDYDRASKRHAVERVMRQMTGSALDTPKLPAAPTVDANGKAAVVTIAPGRKSSIDDLLAGLSEQQKKALARKLLGL